MGKNVYPYASGNKLDDRNVYDYAPFHGTKFFAAWRDARLSVSKKSGTAPETITLSRKKMPEHGKPAAAKVILEYLNSELENIDGMSDGAWSWLNLLLQRFEVTKRIHEEYGSDLRAVDKGAYRNLELYVQMAEILDKAYDATRRLNFLNALLKIVDTLVAVERDLEESQLNRLGRVICHEKAHVNDLLSRRDISNAF